MNVSLAPKREYDETEKLNTDLFNACNSKIHTRYLAGQNEKCPINFIIYCNNFLCKIVTTTIVHVLLLTLPTL